MKIEVRYPALPHEYDREFGFYLDAWLFLFLLSILFIFLAFTIFISRRTKREFYQRKLGSFEEENAYSYDYVFVFKVHQEDEIGNLSEDQLTYSMKNIFDRMEHAQLQVKCFYSCQRDEIYLKVRATPDRLLDEAAKISYKLELDPIKLQIAGSLGLTEKNVVRWKGFVISDLYRVSNLNPYDFIYAKYVKNERLQSIYKEYPIRCDAISKMQILRPVDRINLLRSIFEDNVNSSPPGCGLQLNSLVMKGIVLSHFPLHDFDELVELERRWVKFFSSSVSASDIKNYYGEKIGLYFAFLSYYLSWIRKPAIVGLFVYIFSVIIGRDKSYLPAIFGAVFVVWVTVIAENWKARQATISMEWGTTGFEDEEQERAEYEGIEIPSPVDGQPMLFYSSSNQLAVRLFINVVILSFVAVAICMVVIVVRFQDYLYVNQSDFFTVVGMNYTPIISSLLLVAMIEIMRRSYWKVAILLNEYQNHRTETDYEDNLVSTIFVVQFAFNFFYPTFVAFAKPFTQYQCVGRSCMLELAQVLLVLTFLPIIIHCIEQVVVMKIFQVQKVKKETSDIEPGSSVGVIERQYILAEYNVVDGTFQDYAALMALFGYTSMFVAAFPNGIAIAVVSCEARMRIDGWRLCQAFRRPQPKKAEDIGVWENVMHFLSILAVVYTYAIICFTADFLKNETWSNRWIYFLILEHVTLFIKIYLIIAIEDVPGDVTMQLARQDHIVSKVIDNESDETEDMYRSQQAEFSVSELEISAYDRDYAIPLPPNETEPSYETISLYKLIEGNNIFDFDKEE